MFYYIREKDWYIDTWSGDKESVLLLLHEAQYSFILYRRGVGGEVCVCGLSVKMESK